MIPFDKGLSILLLNEMRRQLTGIIALQSLAVLIVNTKCDMEWNTILNRAAVCNDFTPAGFFADVIPNINKWLIFLESGGTCYSNTSCTNRYFRDSVRTNPLYQDGAGKFTATKAKSSGVAGHTVVSPLVTSMLTFYNTSYFSSGFQITGLGVLDRNCSLNPVFCSYNRVILPYCSSDLWIGDGAIPSNCDIPSSMYDACYSNKTYESCKLIGDKFFKECFLANSSGLQFIYRGSVIFREAIKQLVLANATDVVLAGSSAGGVGAINQAKWLLNYLHNYTNDSTLNVIIDSAWFLNFHDNINKAFYELRADKDSPIQGNFLNAVQGDIAANCNDFSYGSPCCISAHCMLTKSEYYPSAKVPTLAIISLYDVYLLADTIRTLPGVSPNAIQNSGFIPYLEVVEEYGGAMNTSLSFVVNRAGKFSYIVSECFQHIYLVTSTLWGEGRVLGTQTIEIDTDVGSFR